MKLAIIALALALAAGPCEIPEVVACGDQYNAYQRAYRAKRKAAGNPVRRKV